MDADSLLNTRDEMFEKSLDGMIFESSYAQLQDLDVELFMKELTTSSESLEPYVQKIHVARLRIKEVMGTLPLDSLTGENIEHLVDKEFLSSAINLFSKKTGSTIRGAKLLNIAIKNTFMGAPEQLSVALELNDCLNEARLVSGVIGFQKQTKLFDFNKKNREIILAYYTRNYTSKVKALYEKINEGHPSITTRSFIDWVSYHVGIKSNLMEFKAPMKKEWQKIESNYGVTLESILVSMYEEGVAELRLTSLYAKTNIWRMVVDFFKNVVLIEQLDAAPRSITTNSRSLHVNEEQFHSIRSDLLPKLKNGLARIRKSFPALSTSRVMDFVNRCFMSVININKNVGDDLDKELFIKFGMPMCLMISEAFKKADKIALPAHTRSITFTSKVYRMLSSALPMLWEQGLKDYTMEDLALDLMEKFTEDIDTLVEEIRTSPQANNEMVIKTFKYYTDKASTRITSDYKDIPPRGAFDRRYNSEINHLLKKMYLFSLQSFGASTYVARISIWQKIEEVITERIIQTSRRKTEPVRKQFKKRSLNDYLDVVCLLADAIETDINNSAEIESSDKSLPFVIDQSQQALLLYFQETGDFPLKANHLHESLVQTARNMFDEIDQSIENLETSNLSPGELSELMTSIFEEGWAKIHNYLVGVNK